MFRVLDGRQALGERLVDGEVDNFASRNHHPPADQIVGFENGVDEVMFSTCHFTMHMSLCNQGADFVFRVRRFMVAG